MAAGTAGCAPAPATATEPDLRNLTTRWFRAVCEAFGIGARDHSFGYVAGWAGGRRQWLAEEVVERWGRAVGTAESVALALLVTGLALEHLGRLEEAAATFHGLTTVYEAFRPVRRHVAAAQEGLRRLRPEGPSAD